MNRVEAFLATGPRPSGSTNSLRSAEYLLQELKVSGVQNSRIDSFNDSTPHGTGLFYNVIAEIGPKDAPIILIGSHFDSKLGVSDHFVGANDGGSSTGLLLELASLLAKNPPKNHTLMLAFFDGEEAAENYGNTDGLHGSKKLAQDISTNMKEQPVKGVIILDMVGDKDLTITLPANCTRELVELTLQAAHEADARKHFRMTRMNVLDDHVPFLLKGMPVVNLIDFEFGSEPGLNDYWHTDKDTVDKLSPDSLETIGKVTLGIINRLMADND